MSLSCETASQNQGEMCGGKRAGLGSPAEYHTHDTGQGGLDIFSSSNSLSMEKAWTPLQNDYYTLFILYVSEPYFLVNRKTPSMFLSCAQNWT